MKVDSDSENQDESYNPHGKVRKRKPKYIVTIVKKKRPKLVKKAKHELQTDPKDTKAGKRNIKSKSERKRLRLKKEKKKCPLCKELELDKGKVRKYIILAKLNGFNNASSY